MNQQKFQNGLEYHITGIVQGVGFRPFVYRIALQNGLKGDVCNTSEGVWIHVFGNSESLKKFDYSLRHDYPVLAHVDRIEMKSVQSGHMDNFRIIQSIDHLDDFIPVSADLAVCADCAAEILDPENRRYHYPFTNCTNCGPRFSIIKEIPYDRDHTSMDIFHMCDHCRKEYEDPGDRRFHAQPTACGDCGPWLTYLEKGQMTSHEDALQKAAEALAQGKIVAVKGIGGFHLACNAENNNAVKNLRKRKHRNEKPFALMARNIEAINEICTVSSAEKKLLESPAAPIVLLNIKMKGKKPLSAEIAPGKKQFGFMLPYTPLHILLFNALPSEINFLVMTSANFSEDPIIFRDEDLNRLNVLCDGILTHNRKIVTRIDDSVVYILKPVENSSEKKMMIRRSRGYAPEPVRMGNPCRQILAVGPDMKNTFCLTRDHYAFVSHYMGDLEDADVNQSFLEQINHYENLFRIKPVAIGCDLHPNYYSTKYAEMLSKKEDIPLFRIQHHYAHIASVLAENGCFCDDPVIGLAFDGTGYGEDGTIWGGEVLLCSQKGFVRSMHLKTFPLPGGDSAVRFPAKIALAWLWSEKCEWTDDLAPVRSIGKEKCEILSKQLQHRINCINTSSMGRLFDAVSALIGIRESITYDGQAASELEDAIDPACKESYAFNIEKELIDPVSVICDILKDIRGKIPGEIISAKFHNAVINLAEMICIRMKKETGISTVALGGGVWQNQIILSGTIKKLEKNGIKVLIPRELPINDGGISFGQVSVVETILDHDSEDKNI